MTDRAYTRISFDALTSGSIEKQHARIEAFAGKDVTWYEDRSVSGAKVAFGDRPDGARLMRDLQPGDRVLVTKIDRAARNVRDLLNLVELIGDSGASIVFVDQHIDTAGPMGRFMLTLLGAIAELEAGIVSERRLESLEVFAKEGRHVVGKAPFGFRSIDNPSGRGLVIALDPETAPKLREAIGRVMAGESQEQVRHSIGMSKTGFHSLIHNPRLAGMTPDGDGVVMIEGVPRVNPAAALLTMGEWRQLQDYLGRPDKTWSKQNGYGAALRCGVCDERLYKNLSKRKSEYATYRCTKTKHAKGVGAPSIMAHTAESYMEKMFLQHYGDKPFTVKKWLDDESVKLEAVSTAQVALDAVQKRLLASTSADEDQRLLQDMLAAREGLRQAEALPGDRVLVTEETGITFADLWGSADDDKRSTLLRSVAVWSLQTGRGSVEQRISFGLPGVA